MSDTLSWIAEKQAAASAQSDYEEVLEKRIVDMRWLNGVLQMLVAQKVQGTKRGNLYSGWFYEWIDVPTMTRA